MNNPKHQKQYSVEKGRNQKFLTGFTLAELLITITVFSIILTVVLSLFASVFKEQRKSLAVAHLLNSASYATEYMARALRMAAKDLNGTCITAKENYQNPGGDSSKVRFLRYDSKTTTLKCQEFALNGTTLEVKKCDTATWCNPVGISLTPAALEVASLTFSIAGETQTELPNYQPKVTFILKLKTKGEEPQELNIQSSVSQRALDVIR